ncbi:hypothetical protein TNCV_3335841 [Trichonephila clavipes]|nr:hypothetical protein TNCV_3335841 [Trichonephila clavipes]
MHCSRYTCSERDPTSTTTRKRLTPVSFRNLDPPSTSPFEPPIHQPMVPTTKNQSRELLGETVHISCNENIYREKNCYVSLWDGVACLLDLIDLGLANASFVSRRNSRPLVYHSYSIGKRY